MTYISVGRRFIAIIIDGLISLIWAIPLGNSSTSNGSASFSLTGTPFLVSLIVGIGYFVVMEALVGGTVGKLVVGIRVVKEDGSKLDWGSSLIRNVLRIVDYIPYIIPYLVAAISVWNSPTRQRVGDRIAKTVVIQAGSNRNVGQAPMGQPMGQPMAQPMQPPMQQGPPMPPPPPAAPPAPPEPPQQPPA